MPRAAPAVRIVSVLAGLLTACGSSPGPLASITTSSTATPAASLPATTAPPATSAAASAARAPTTIAAALSTTTVTAARGRTEAPELAQVPNAGQAIVVTTPEYGSSSATLTAYERTPAGWELVMGPWAAWVGRNGFAPPGQKTEGDGRTPSGAYPFSFFFGVAADPGVRFDYRRVPDESIVWDEDPSSPTYNLWVDLDETGGGTDPEGMYQPVAYRHGAVIAYNTARTPGLGSGIFLHASTGKATAGCVSLPVAQLVGVLRWLDPAQQPRIVMGVSP